MNIAAASVIIGILFMFPVNAKTTDYKPFYAGNMKYQEGAYALALEEYQKMISGGFEGGALYFNMANCYYKQGDYPRAVLYYEKARRFIPRDPDVISNLAVAASYTRAYAFPARKNFFMMCAEMVWRMWTVPELGVWVTLLNLLVCACLAARLYAPAARRWLMFFAVLCGIAAVLCGYYLYQRAAVLDAEGVVVSESTPVYFEPMAGAAVHFTLYGGQKVLVHAAHQGWLKIERPDRSIGWISKKTLEMI